MKYAKRRENVKKKKTERERGAQSEGNLFRSEIKSSKDDQRLYELGYEL